eukprot:1253744-Rhodomonas_salina.1
MCVRQAPLGWRGAAVRGQSHRVAARSSARQPECQSDAGSESPNPLRLRLGGFQRRNPSG